ncbi:MAG: TonB-dependent receptor, partial [Bacteroidales bacterium]|nr:TonB-dependent receptor [Bacteroidales bacterium]
MKRFIVIVTFLACLPFITFSQYTISGVVYDKETKTTLAGAHVIVPGTYTSSISGTKGEFKITGLEKGTITLKISYMGYKSFIEEFNLQSDMTKHVELEKSPIMQDAVIISATRAYDRTPVVYSTLTKIEIKKVNLGKDLPYLLSFGPSVTTTSDAGNGVGYSSIRIRGTDMRGINVTINGIPLNDPESHNVFWVDLPDLSSSVENIQIQRGVGTSTNGAAAFGASINIQTNNLEPEPYAAANTSFGSFNTFRNNLSLGTGLIKDKFSFDARISNIVSDGYIDRASSDLTSLFASGAFYGKSTLMKINYFSGKEKTYQAWEGVPSDSLETNRTLNPAGAYLDDNGSVQYYNNQTDNYKQDNFQLIIARELGSKFLINLATHYTKGRGYYESYKANQKLENYGDEYFVPDSSVSRSDLIRQKWLDNDFSGITFSGIYDSKRNLKLTIGGAWNTYSGDHFGYVIWAKEALIIDKEKQYYFNNGKKTDMNMFAKVDYAIVDNLNVYGDIQYRYIDYLVKGTHDNLMVIDYNPTFNFFNPKMGLFYVISDKHKTFFSFAIANREPSRRNYIDADPGETPTYETLYDYELGYEYSSAKVRAGMNLYYMDYNNQLV